MEFEEISSRCERLNFNLVGVVNVDEYDSLAEPKFRLSNYRKDARSAVLVGTGGKSFWNSLSPSERSLHNPIDRATVHRLRPLADDWKREDSGLQINFPFRSSGGRVSFRRLAEAAGFGTCNSVLGILLHPEFGPWVSLRALFLTSVEMPASKPIDFSPCAPCAKPCISACPASAIRVTGFEARSCGWHQAIYQTCVSGCLSRRACVVGPQHAYGEEEGAHRQGFAARALLRYVAPKLNPRR